MKTLETIQKSITTFANQLAKLSEERDAAGLKLEEIRRNYASNIVTDSGSQAADLRREVSEQSIDHDALVAACAMVQSDLEKAENEKAIIELYNRDGQRYAAAWRETQQAISTLTLAIPELETLREQITSAIGKLFANTEAIGSTLNGLNSYLDGTLSLKSFLKGDLKPSGDENRTDILDNAGKRLRDIVSTLEMSQPDENGLDALSNLVTQLYGWSCAISTFQNGAALIMNRKSLVPKIPRINKHQIVSVPPPRTPLKSYMPPVPAPRFDRNKPKGEQLMAAG